MASLKVITVIVNFSVYNWGGGVMRWLVLISELELKKFDMKTVFFVKNLL